MVAAPSRAMAGPLPLSLALSLSLSLWACFPLALARPPLLLSSGAVAHSRATLPNSHAARSLEEVKRLAPSACTGIRCPGKSRCKSVGGAPTCACPRGQGRLVRRGSAYVCSTAGFSAASPFIDPQNAARAAVGAPPLAWDAGLARQAQSWAKYLQRNQQCLPQIQSSRATWGQNVAAFSNLAPINTSAAMNLWVRTGAGYKLAPFSVSGGAGCPTGFWEDCATYLQVVWQYTTKVGCGTASCGKLGLTVWVCDYTVPGLTEPFLPYSPCFKTKCAPPPVCNPNLGLPATCTASPCSKVSCSSGASCALTSDVIPYCRCPAASAAIRDVCVPIAGPTEPVPQTSVAFYPSTNLGGTPFVARTPVPTSEDPGCINLPSRLQKKTKSMEVVWKVGDQKVSGGKAVSCGNLAFWNLTNCFGGAIVYSNIQGYPSLVQTDADSYVRKTVSISCV